MPSHRPSCSDNSFDYFSTTFRFVWIQFRMLQFSSELDMYCLVSWHAWFLAVMCESGFGFESGFKAFLAGFGFGFRPQKGESRSGFKKKMGGSLYCSWIRIRIRIRADWIRIQENRGGFGFVWIRIRGVWIRIRIRIRDVRIRTSLVSSNHSKLSKVKQWVN